MFISDCMNKLAFPSVNKREVDTKNITLLGQSGTPPYIGGKWVEQYGSLEPHFVGPKWGFLLIFLFWNSIF